MPLTSASVSSPLAAFRSFSTLHATTYLLCRGHPDVYRPPALVVGARSVYEIVDTSDMADLIGIVFSPGGFAPFASDGLTISATRRLRLMSLADRRAARNPCATTCARSILHKVACGALSTFWWHDLHRGLNVGGVLHRFSLPSATSHTIPASQASPKRRARLAGASAAFRKSFAKRWDSHPRSGAASSVSSAPSASCIPAQTSAGPSWPSIAVTTINPTSPMSSAPSPGSTPPPTPPAGRYGPTTSAPTEFLPPVSDSSKMRVDLKCHSVGVI